VGVGGVVAAGVGGVVAVGSEVGIVEGVVITPVVGVVVMLGDVACPPMIFMPKKVALAAITKTSREPISIASVRDLLLGAVDGCT
jgi:hypothetical protein